MAPELPRLPASATAPGSLSLLVGYRVFSGKRWFWVWWSFHEGWGLSPQPPEAEWMSNNCTRVIGGLGFWG